MGNKAYVGTPARNPLTVPVDDAAICCEIARRPAPSKGYYYSLVPNTDGKTANCTLYTSVSSTKTVKGAYSGQAASSASGECEIFSEVSGSEHKAGSTSGSSAAPTSVTLYPS